MAFVSILIIKLKIANILSSNAKQSQKNYILIKFWDISSVCPMLGSNQIKESILNLNKIFVIRVMENRIDKRTVECE